SLGAGHARLMRQLIVESAIVGVSGGIAGLAVAVVLLRLAPSILPADFPRLDSVAVDMNVVALAAALSLATSIVCGIMPASQARRSNLVEALAEDGAAPVGGGMRTRIARTRALIMIGQVAVACVLLVGAALVTRSFTALIHADRGYDPVNVLTARLPLPATYPPERRGQLLDTLVQRLRAVPGITHAAYSSALPLVSFGGFTAFTMRSPANPALAVDVQAVPRVVSPDYFAAMRLRLVAGRTLSDTDTAAAPPAIVVNRSFARQYLGDHAIGVRIPTRGPSAGGLRFVNERADWQIVGVVDDLRQDSVDAPPRPRHFASFAQLLPGALRNFDPILVVRTATDPITYMASLRAIVRESAPALALDSVTT